MISKQTISELTRKYQTTEDNIAREYCQHLFLSSLYQKRLASEIMFKGGTALRIIYHSPRFSGDLDFTCRNIKFKNLETVILETAEEVAKTGIEVDIEESRQTSGGYLAIVSFNFLNFRQSAQIEISLRQSARVKPEINLINSDYLPPFNVVSLPEKILAKEKVAALLARAKPRDFFDIYFLLRSDLSAKKGELKLNKVFDKLESVEIDFKKELGPLLPRSHQAILRDFSSVLRREIKKYL
ncbi:MAG: nucleotidyl transferase AbiEii/AbiGii toxin family protein [Candidatus Omnitrophota bacterium]